MPVGLDLNHLYKISKAFKGKYYLDFTVPKMGLITGISLKEFIRLFTKGKNLEELIFQYRLLLQI